jgi:hypothetical protein
MPKAWPGWQNGVGEREAHERDTAERGQGPGNRFVEQHGLEFLTL